MNHLPPKAHILQAKHRSFISDEPASNTLRQYASQVEHQRLCWPAMDACGVSVYLRRDDAASSHYPGNKFYKLFYNLQEMTRSGKQAVVSFGGAYSNHIHALAMMGKQYDIPTVGIIRGHTPKKLSPTLGDAQRWGMRLLFLDKPSYQAKDLQSLKPLLTAEYGDYSVLPEGGENQQGVLGCQAIATAIHQRFVESYTVCCAVGSGTTMAGIVSALPDDIPCIGFSALKGQDTLSAKVQQWLDILGVDHHQWKIMNDYHHGGYAKTTPELLAFMHSIEVDNKLLLEPIYSAKMLWGVEQMAKAGYWSSDSTLVLVHGGGLQGRRGFDLP